MFNRILSRVAWSVFYAYLIISAAGLPNLAYAINCNDVVDNSTGAKYSDALTNFLYFGNKTYALARSGSTLFAFDANISREYLFDGVDSVSLKKVLSTAKYGAARPVSIPNGEINSFILKNFGPSLGTTYIDAWREFGTNVFTTITGASLPFSNWGTEPPAEQTPSGVMMGGDGKWYPVTGGKATAQIVEFNDKLDCAFDMNILTNPSGGTGGGTDTGVLGPENGDDPNANKNIICTSDLNHNGNVGEVGEMGYCLTTPQGNLCTIDALDCNAAWQPPSCPAGTVMDYDRDMCQADHVSVQCPLGYTWDSTIDRCVATITCQDGGVFNTLTDRCEKIVEAAFTCPSGYTADTDNNLCFKDVVCSGTGVYNRTTDRCEASIGACPSDFMFNQATARCEKEPSCSAGAVYSAPLDKCLSGESSCLVAGYSWNPSSSRCEKAPDCANGSVYNPATNKCDLHSYQLSDAILRSLDWGRFVYSGSSNTISGVAYYDSGLTAPSGTISLTGTTFTGKIINAGCTNGYPVFALIGEGNSLVGYSSTCGAYKYRFTPETCLQVGGIWGEECTDYFGRTGVCDGITYYAPTGGYTCSSVNSAAPVEVCDAVGGVVHNILTSYQTIAASTSDECLAAGGTWSQETICESMYGDTGPCEDYWYMYNPTLQVSCGKAVYTASCQPAFPVGPEISRITLGENGLSGTIVRDNLTLWGDGWFLRGVGGTDTGYIAFTPETLNPACPNGSFDGVNDVCYATVATTETAADCGSSVLNMVTDKCEINPACSGSGYVFNPTTNRCELSPPTCPEGSTYSNVYDKCIKPVVSCADGYSWNTSRNRCEKQPPECLVGTSYNPVTNKCEKAVVCPDSYSWNGSTCVKTYAATLVGAKAYDKPFYVLGINNWQMQYYGASDGVDDVAICPTLPYATYGACPTSSSYTTLSISSIIKTGVNAPLYIGDNISSTRLNNLQSYRTRAGYAAPSPGTYGGTYTCPSGGALSGTTCVFGATTCDDGSTPVSGICQANPICPNGSFDGANDVCYHAAVACEADWSFDSVSGQCTKPVTCVDNGALDTSSDRCVKAVQVECPVGTVLDGTGLCISAPVCDQGAFVVGRDRCEATVVSNCGAYQWDTIVEKCTASPTCPTDASFSLSSTIGYSADLDRCVSQAVHTCPNSTTWHSLPINKCEAVPICGGAVYYDTVKNECLVSAGTCPYGEQYACMMNPTSGTYQCSPNACVQVAGEGAAEDIGEKMDELYLQDDGPRDEEGRCLGTIYIFSGKAGRCRPPGWVVGYVNSCCAQGQAIADNTGGNTSIMTAASGIYKAGTAAYQAYQGFQAAQGIMSLGGSPQTALDLASTVVNNAVDAGAMSAEAASSYLSGASTAIQGGTQTGAMATAGLNAVKGLAAAAVVWAVGATVEALGGDQDVQAGAQLGAVGAMYAYAPALLTGPQALVMVAMIVVMRIAMGAGCDANDITTAMANESGRCHYIGGFCEKKWFGMGCAQTARGYCCFNSLLARIIHEQGRPQLVAFGPDGGWGSPKNPNCRGFQPEEFQAIDFSRIDLSEYFDTVETDLAKKVEGAHENITNTMQMRFDQMQAK